MKRLTIRLPQDRGILYDLKHYPAGEIQVNLTQKCIDQLPGKDEYEIVTNSVFDVVELAQLKDALEHAKYMKDGGFFFYKNLFMHYLPFSRADRRFVPGDTFGLKVFADLINSLGFTAVWTFDAHSATAEILFKKESGYPLLANIKPTDVLPTDEITKVIMDLGQEGLVLIAPDKGARSRYDLNRYKLPVVDGIKNRDAATGVLSGFDVCRENYFEIAKADKGLIIDDICDGGGTFIGLGEAIHKINPAIELYLYVSHGIFSKGTECLFQQFKKVYISDYSIQNAEECGPWISL